MWDRFYNGDQPRADRVRAMLTRKIQEETLRTYLFSYSHVYDSVSMVTLAELFELSVPDVHSIVSKMVINAELMVGARGCRLRRETGLGDARCCYAGSSYSSGARPGRYN